VVWSSTLRTIYAYDVLHHVSSFCYTSSIDICNHQKYIGNRIQTKENTGIHFNIINKPHEYNNININNNYYIYKEFKISFLT